MTDPWAEFTCPVCGTQTVPYRGKRSLCLPCTEAEVGETYETLRDRVTVLVHKSAKRKWSLFE